MGRQELEKMGVRWQDVSAKGIETRQGGGEALWGGWGDTCPGGQGRTERTPGAPEGLLRPLWPRPRRDAQELLGRHVRGPRFREPAPQPHGVLHGQEPRDRGWGTPAECSDSPQAPGWGTPPPFGARGPSLPREINAEEPSDLQAGGAWGEAS